MQKVVLEFINMDIVSIISPIFWGVLLLSLLVFIHEGGHCIAAHLCGMRVTKFFLGMPTGRFKLSFTSKKNGTEYGVTPLLLGGFTAICGMEGNKDPKLAEILALVTESGKISVKELCTRLSLDEKTCYRLLEQLVDWQSIEPFYDENQGEAADQKSWPDQFSSVKRDGRLLTLYDRGHDFSAPGTSEAGSPRALSIADDLRLSKDEFLEHEFRRVYAGRNVFQRLFVLLAGILVNVFCGLALVVFLLTMVGIPTPKTSPEIGRVAEKSLAAQAFHLQAGDKILSINNTKTDTWDKLVSEIKKSFSQEREISITYQRKDKDYHVSKSFETLKKLAQKEGIAKEAPLKLGIEAATEKQKLPILKALRYSFDYALRVAGAAFELINPSRAGEIINNSSSVVGISVMAANAAREGLAPLLFLAAAISLSLGFMNLLPIPPLDGGKVLFECIQLIIRRPLSARVQTLISYVGVALFIMLFIFLLHHDILRLIHP